MIPGIILRTDQVSGRSCDSKKTISVSLFYEFGPEGEWRRDWIRTGKLALGPVHQITKVNVGPAVTAKSYGAAV